MDKLFIKIDEVLNLKIPEEVFYLNNENLIIDS